MLKRSTSARNDRSVPRSTVGRSCPLPTRNNRERALTLPADHLPRVGACVCAESPNVLRAWGLGTRYREIGVSTDWAIRARPAGSKACLEFHSVPMAQIAGRRVPHDRVQGVELD
jgi:hypothetical protein